MPTNLHLIEKLRKMRRIAKDSHVYESGDWSIPEARGPLYVGGMVYFYEGQAEPAYYGGRITGYRMIAPGNPNAGKMVIEFIAMPNAVGHRTGRDGWGNEQKSDPPLGA